jgi:hypothetical protein
MTYSTDKFNGSNLETIHKDRVFEIIAMNRKGNRPLKLMSEKLPDVEKESSYQNDLLDESITRFDGHKQHHSRKKRKPRKKRPDNGEENKRTGNHKPRNEGSSGDQKE